MVVMMMSKSSFAFFALFIHVQISLGARPALPMGVAPEAIVEKLASSIGSNKSPLL
jgi:hypothetical protein